MSRQREAEIAADLHDPQTLRYEYELDAPLEKVWRAVTIPAFLARWLGEKAPPKKAGDKSRKDWTPSPAIGLRLLDAQPCNFVRYLLHEEGSALPESVVTFRLLPNDTGGTTFRIEHDLPVGKMGTSRMQAANSNLPRMRLAA